MADVVIVGAGFAGLAAALDLHDAGLSVVVLEARERVGGRVLSVELENGELAELGAEWIMPDDDVLQATIDSARAHRERGGYRLPAAGATRPGRRPGGRARRVPGGRGRAPGRVGGRRELDGGDAGCRPGGRPGAGRCEGALAGDVRERSGSCRVARRLALGTPGRRTRRLPAHGSRQRLDRRRDRGAASRRPSRHARDGRDRTRRRRRTSRWARIGSRPTRAWWRCRCVW